MFGFKKQVKPFNDLYDMHCHVFYQVDDGSRSVEMSKSMLDTAYEEGIRHIIATPHFNPRIWNKDQQDLAERYQIMQQLLTKTHPDMDIHLGAEIFYRDDETPDLYMSHTAPTMAGSRYVLFEFITDIEFRKMREAIREAVTNGYIPILAHIERFFCLLDNIDRVYEISEAGCYLQTNAGTIIGKSGSVAQKFIFKLMKDEMIDFVGTDAHRDEGNRQMKMQSAYQEVARRFGEDYAVRIFHDNPEHILADKVLDDVL